MSCSHAATTSSSRSCSSTAGDSSRAFSATAWTWAQRRCSGSRSCWARNGPHRASASQASPTTLCPPHQPISAAWRAGTWSRSALVSKLSMHHQGGGSAAAALDGRGVRPPAVPRPSSGDMDTTTWSTVSYATAIRYGREHGRPRWNPILCTRRTKRDPAERIPLRCIPRIHVSVVQ